MSENTNPQPTVIPQAYPLVLKLMKREYVDTGAQRGWRTGTPTYAHVVGWVRKEGAGTMGPGPDLVPVVAGDGRLPNAEVFRMPDDLPTTRYSVEYFIPIQKVEDANS